MTQKTSRGGLKRILLRMLVLSIPIVLLSVLTYIAFRISPMRFFDGEYAWFSENQVYSQSHDDYCRVLILGDSQAKAAWVPDVLSDDTYNFSLGGVSPIEEYYYFYDYLQKNPPPEYVIYSQGPTHFFVLDTFWTRSVYFHRLGMDQVLDVFATQKSLNNKETILGDKDISDLLLYYTYSPVYYSSAFLKGLLSDRQEDNAEAFNTAVSGKGHILFGKAKRLHPAGLANYAAFAQSELIDHYFRMIIELCDEYDIRFIYQSLPVSTITWNNLDKKALDEYESYMDLIRSDYPNVSVSSDFPVYADSFFRDSPHLSEEGARKFCAEMLEKYDYIFAPDNFGE